MTRQLFTNGIRIALVGCGRRIAVVLHHGDTGIRRVVRRAYFGRGVLGAVVLLLTLAACGSGSGFSQQQTTDHYQVQFSLDGLGLGERLATVELRNQAGQPADAEVVVLLPVMPQHGMASPELTATRVAPGRYEARGEFFTMAGSWEIELRLSANGREETVSFQVVATE